MKNRFLITISILFLVILTACSLLIGCNSENNDTPSNPETPGNTENGNDTEDEDETLADLVLFIGQSNMAGRGTASEATQVQDGHAYEFRAISDPTKLYPLQEPFGINENNDESGVTETKKTGSMVSAFCESYYENTGVPIVAVSCSKGGESIDFFATDGKPYKDAVARMTAAKEYLTSGESEVELRNTYVVWLQGESDGDAGVSAADYQQALDKIVRGFQTDIGADQFFVIPIGGNDVDDGTKRANSNTIRDAQILYCQDSDYATVISRQLYDLYLYGYMKDNVHFTQEGYEIVGADAGANMAYFVNTGKKPDCAAFFEEEETTREGGAWQETDGKVVIPASAALEQSRYASYSTNKKTLSWELYNGEFDGIIQTPSSGEQWNITYAFASAPQVHYTFNVKNTGKYYLYLFTSYPDTGSNSVYANLDDGDLIECSTQSYEPGLWVSNSEWCFDITEPGEHTITIFAREDGVVLNQIVLSQNASESFKKKEAQPVSARNPYTLEGEFVEVDGSLMIDLASALDNSSYAFSTSGAADGYDEVFTWERSVAFEGVQVYPDVGVQWGTNNISPKLSYRAYFSTPGDYYVMLYSSFNDGNSDSVFISVNDGPIVTCLSYVATGVGKWLADSTWKITIPYAGVHTINIYAREDGAVLHKLYLTQEPLLDHDLPANARVSLLDNDVYSTAGSGALIEGNDAIGTFNVDFDVVSSYIVYVDADAKQGAGISLKLGDNSPQTYTFPAGISGWSRAFTLTIDKKGTQSLNLSATGDVTIRRVNIVRQDIKDGAGVQTLVIGDSYTSKTAWKHFDEQTSSIGGVTIGIGGTKVNTWSSHYRDLKIYDPKNIVIHIGVNDIDGGISGSDCGNSITALIDSLREQFPNTKIFYVSICDNEKFPEKWGEYSISNGIVRDYAETQENVYYIDFASIMKTEGPKMENMGFRDELHLNDTAYVLFSQIICDAVLAANANTIA